MVYHRYLWNLWHLNLKFLLNCLCLNELRYLLLIFIFLIIFLWFFIPLLLCFLFFGFILLINFLFFFSFLFWFLLIFLILFLLPSDLGFQIIKEFTLLLEEFLQSTEKFLNFYIIKILFSNLNQSFKNYLTCLLLQTGIIFPVEFSNFDILFFHFQPFFFELHYFFQILIVKRLEFVNIIIIWRLKSPRFVQVCPLIHY